MTAFDPATEEWLARALAGEVEFRMQAEPQTSKPDHPCVAALKARNALDSAQASDLRAKTGAPAPALPDKGSSGRAGKRNPWPYRPPRTAMRFGEGEADALVAAHLETKGVTQLAPGYAQGAEIGSGSRAGTGVGTRIRGAGE